jgi:hypothetical protein
MSTQLSRRTPAPPAPSEPGGSIGRGRWERLAVVLFLGPALTFYVLFMIVPLAGTILLSFTE